MNADCAFTIGASHTVCQDYARTATKDRCISAWLADGCSSSPDTDWGARLLVQAAVKHEAKLHTNEGAPGTLPTAFLDAVTKTTTRTVKQLNLPPTCLDATLLGIVTDSDNGRFRVVIYGDGVAVLGRRDGTTDVYEVSYARNYPLYLNYRADGERAARWTAASGNERIVKVLRFCNAAGKYEPLPGSKSDAAVSAEPFLLEGNCADYRFAAVFSDGVTSFTWSTRDTTRTQPCTLDEVLPELLAVKNWTGAFVQRRMQRFLKDAQARGLRHQDDLACAMVYFGE